MTIKPRSAWRARDPKSRTPWNTSSLAGVCIHWWGSPRAPSSQAGMPALMRSVQGFHMAPGGLGAPNGGADIAYNFVVDLWGGIWTGRGWTTQTGANGTSAANRTHLAIAIAMGTGDKLTDAAKQSVNELIAAGRKKGIGSQVKRHGDFAGTSCPGAEVSAWLAAGRPMPKPEPKAQIRYVLTGKAENVVAKSGTAVKGNARSEKARLRAFLKTHFDKVYERASRGGGTIREEDVK